MAEAKMKPGSLNPRALIDTLSHEGKRDDALCLLSLFQEATGFPPIVWAGRIIGFGMFHYRYASGHEGDMPLAAFAVSNRRITLYLYLGSEEQQDFLKRLGKAKTGKSCVYINKLADVDTAVVAEMVRANLRFVRTSFPGHEAS